MKQTNLLKKRSVLFLAVAVCLVAAIVTGGTLAYFTSEDTQTTPFQMGEVKITLEETGAKQRADGTIGLDFKGDDVLPGKTLAKDPTIVVSDDSVDVYVRAALNIATPADSGITQADLDALEAELKTSILAQKDASGNPLWVAGTDSTGRTVYYYTQKLQAGEKAVLFTQVHIPSAEWDNNVVENSFTIEVKAQAIQAKNLDGVSFDAATNSNFAWFDSSDITF